MAALALLVLYTLKINSIQINPLADTKESMANIYYLVGGVFVSTFLLLVVFKFFKRSTRTLDLVLTFIGFETLFSLFGLDYIGLALTLLLCITKYYAQSSRLLKNFSMIVVTSTFATMIGYSISFLPLFIFAVLLAIYDYIAVFKTKHMVFLAKNIVNTNYIFTIALNYSKKPLDIGSGDFAIPIILFISALFINTALAFIILSLSIIMLCLTIYLLLNKKTGERVIPALPLQVISTVIVYLIFIIF
ncbi:MAG: presenilin family intramembrane aspartyl protease [Candidatus ainarchaeum sp.]|nr:presenilin family intramembrane aspartyl protease [Candidatus ainarchaeum sp.]